MRAQRGENLGGFENSADAKERDRHEPRQRHRPKYFSHTASAEMLAGEQSEQNDNGDRNDIRSKHWRRHFQPFDRAQHRDRRVIIPSP
jgi:hypothetical protein